MHEQRLLGELIRAIRAERKLTQMELAALLGTTQSTISKLESGELELGFSFALRICAATGTDPAQFVTRYQDLVHRLGKA